MGLQRAHSVLQEPMGIQQHSHPSMLSALALAFRLVLIVPVAAIHQLDSYALLGCHVAQVFHMHGLCHVHVAVMLLQVLHLVRHVIKGHSVHPTACRRLHALVSAQRHQVPTAL